MQKCSPILYVVLVLSILHHISVAQLSPNLSKSQIQELRNMAPGCMSLSWDLRSCELPVYTEHGVLRLEEACRLLSAAASILLA